MLGLSWQPQIAEKVLTVEQVDTGFVLADVRAILARRVPIRNMGAVATRSAESPNTPSSSTLCVIAMLVPPLLCSRQCLDLSNVASKAVECGPFPGIHISSFSQQR